ncbi:hypothetical protein BV509_13325 [Rhodovulum sulfidophilum]|nr:hypothetical protein BV509_13325 [Rhodovulum sulfidophilum]
MSAPDTNAKTPLAQGTGTYLAQIPRGDPARQVAQETGAAFGGALYVDSLSDPTGPVPTCLDLLRVTFDTVAGGLLEATVAN